MKKQLFTLLVFGLLSSQSYGQSTPKYANAYLNIGVGARALAMASSATALNGDVTSSYWNPASLVEIKNNIQVGYMHTNYFGGIGSYDYGGVAFKQKNGAAFAFSFIRLGIDGIPNTIDLFRNGQIDYNRITTFSAVDNAFVFSYAQKSLKEGLSFGGNAKVIHRKAGSFANAWGFGVDASLKYQVREDFALALVARDVTSTFTAWKYNFTENEKAVLTQTGNEIPQNSLEIALPRFIFGANKSFKISENYTLSTELDLEMTTDGKRNTLLKTNVLSVDPKFGFELAYSQKVYLRGGIGNFQEVQDVNAGSSSWTLQPNVGAGVTLNAIDLNFAMTDIGDVSDAIYSYVFSVKFKIDSKKAE
jgi:hypothetical protein